MYIFQTMQARRHFTSTAGSGFYPGVEMYISDQTETQAIMQTLNTPAADLHCSRQAAETFL
jgi:hypothetical protein